MQANNWMRVVLPELAKNDHYGTRWRRFYKRVNVNVNSRALVEGKWTIDRLEAWENVRRRVGEGVPLCCSKEDWYVMVFADASDFAWEEAVT